MGDYTYTGVMLTKGNVDFGIITPARRLFKLAVAVFDPNVFYVLQNLHLRDAPGQTAEYQLERIAEGQYSQAKALYAERASEKFLPELLAYVRTLPEGSKSYALDDSDEYAAQGAADELQRALAYALSFDDEYRASVALEKAVAYFVPDRHILPVMKSFITEFKNTFVARPYMLETAQRTEERLLASSGMIRSVMAGIKQEEPASANYGVR